MVVTHAGGAMIHKSVWLDCPPERAFALFTGEISDWWPADRRHIRDSESEMFLLPGGRFYERGGDGKEVELGRVLSWEPPTRLLLEYYVGTDAQHPTEVEIKFAPEAAGTRVTVDHRQLPGCDELWARRAPILERTWDLVLAALGSAAAAD